MDRSVSVEGFNKVFVGTRMRCRREFYFGIEEACCYICVPVERRQGKTGC